MSRFINAEIGETVILNSKLRGEVIHVTNKAILVAFSDNNIISNYVSISNLFDRQLWIPLSLVDYNEEGEIFIENEWFFGKAELQINPNPFYYNGLEKVVLKEYPNLALDKITENLSTKMFAAIKEGIDLDWKYQFGEGCTSVQITLDRAFAIVIAHRAKELGLGWDNEKIKKQAYNIYNWLVSTGEFKFLPIGEKITLLEGDTLRTVVQYIISRSKYNPSKAR